MSVEDYNKILKIYEDLRERCTQLENEVEILVDAQKNVILGGIEKRSPLARK
jgi:hypothetical protein